jgi:hypothetical protein
MMEQLGQQSSGLNTARRGIRRCWYSNSCFSFWWFYYCPGNQDATEEYDGSAWQLLTVMNTAEMLSGAQVLKQQV